MCEMRQVANNAARMQQPVRVTYKNGFSRDISPPKVFETGILYSAQGQQVPMYFGNFKDITKIEPLTIQLI